MIFSDRLMQLTCLEVLHAKERKSKLNIDINKLNLGRLWQELNFKLSLSAT